jgi:hypothetical protein
VRHAEVTVPAHGEVTVPFTVRVPARATPGDHQAAIVVEPPHATRSRGRFSVVEVLRSAVAVEIQVPGPVRYATAIAGVALHKPSSAPTVVVRLRNSGDKLCRPTLAVSLRAAGASAQTVRRALNTILPGDTIAYPLLWPRGLSAGSYAASARTSGCGPAASAHETISYGRATPAPTTTAAQQHSSGGTKWWEVALIVLAGIAVGTGLTLRRRRREDAR